MNVAIRLTLDGMVRALRWKLHELAEEAVRDARGDAAARQPASNTLGQSRQEAADGRTRE